jgi:hypothetical protein
MKENNDHWRFNTFEKCANDHKVNIKRKKLNMYEVATHK